MWFVFSAFLYYTIFICKSLSNSRMKEGDAAILSSFSGAVPAFFDRIPMSSAKLVFYKKIHRSSGLQKGGKHGKLNRYIERVCE